MTPDDMMLPRVAEMPDSLRVHPEWYTDPPPWVIRFLDDRVVREIYRVKLENLARAAQIESEMYAQVAELMRKG